jgi:hypothetical protein
MHTTTLPHEPQGARRVKTASGGVIGQRAYPDELELMCSSSFAYTQEGWDMEDVCG